MNIVYLGNLTSYVTQNDLIGLRSMGHKVTILNNSPVRGDPVKELSRINVLNLYNQKYLDVLYATLGGTFTPLVFSTLRRGVGVLKDIIGHYQIDLIYAQWGSNMIPTVKTIQAARLKLPIVYNFLSFPQNVYKWKVIFENWYCRKAIENLDGRIHATKNMYQYFDHHFDLKKHGLDIIMTPFFSRRYFYRKRLPLLSEKDGEPHLVFIGPIGLPWDDIRQEIYGITREKIHLHMAQTDVPVKENSYLHLFQYFPAERLVDGSLATFMTQFDACIVLFNFKVCTSMDRFYTSLPSRFLFALNAGIPIVIPGGYLPACEEFVNEHKIGFTYSDPVHLKSILNDDMAMRRARRNAIEETADFTYEKNFNKLNELMKGVTA